MILLVAVAAAGTIVMLLWNFVVPSVIGWGELNYGQAVALLVLSRLLFSGFGGFQKNFLKHSKYSNYPSHPNHQEMKARLKGMSKSEKKEYIKNYMYISGRRNVEE